MSQTIHKTCLFKHHQQLNAKMGDFSGYDLPLWYSSIKEEHLAVRTSAGIFDISHMGILEITGPDALMDLQKLSCNDVNKALPGKMVYSMILNERAGILDDVMIGAIQDRFIMVVNASNKLKIIDWLNQHKSDSTSIKLLSEEVGFIAVQGPKACELIDNALDLSVAQTSRFSLFETDIMGSSCTVLRTGYTGEDGFELFSKPDLIQKIWGAAIRAGVVPCGLGARDTLRCEAGLPLYGQELSEEITPLMTRYKWVVSFNKEFIGKKALQDSEEESYKMTTVGIEMVDRMIARPKHVITQGGYVTSGTFSPSLEKAIGMALVPASVSEIGQILTIEIRRKLCEAKVVKIPFQ